LASIVAVAPPRDAPAKISAVATHPGSGVKVSAPEPELASAQNAAMATVKMLNHAPYIEADAPLAQFSAVNDERFLTPCHQSLFATPGYAVYVHTALD
jgi:hypothetical protein